ncbi:MAG: PilZ domain-containing protein [Sphingobium sp.]
MDGTGPGAPMQLVRIRDISEGGAKLEGNAPAVGTAILLSRGIIEIAAKVVWTSRRYFGVAFDDPVSVEMVMRAAGQSRSPERPPHAAALTDGVGRATALPRRRAPPPLDRTTFGLRVATRH